jgi:hypothetical protein
LRPKFRRCGPPKTFTEISPQPVSSNILPLFAIGSYARYARSSDPWRSQGRLRGFGAPWVAKRILGRVAESALDSIGARSQNRIASRHFGPTRSSLTKVTVICICKNRRIWGKCAGCDALTSDLDFCNKKVPGQRQNIFRPALHTRYHSH